MIDMASQTHGDRRRFDILAAAADLSTAEGLDSLSFSRIAGEVGLTKAGVAGHFESKEALQLAVIDAAAARYSEPLLAAGNSALPGLPRLRQLALAWFDLIESIDYRGGCFFASAGLAFAGRPGRVREAIASHTKNFILVLEEQAQLALRLGEIRSSRSPELLAFQIHALAQEANLRRELLGVAHAFQLARDALKDLLAEASAIGAALCHGED